MRRNCHGTNDIVRSNHSKLEVNEYNMKSVMVMLKEIKTDMRQFTFHMRMDTCDLGSFFPLKNDTDLQSFMDRTHPDWPLRMRGFYHLLFTTVTKTKRRFGGALLHTLFSRDFVSTHRWPYPG